MSIKKDIIAEELEDRRKEYNEAIIVAEAMERYGGSFVKCLSRAIIHADFINLQKIKIAFPEYWAQYKEIGENTKCKLQKK